MRRIASREGGDTDTSRDYEYTDWAAVDRCAVEFVDGVVAQRAPEIQVAPRSTRRIDAHADA
ncbi:MAG TPA: hypothetical protein VGG91_04290 [Myxococcaceae bacterium]|jgi:menaquinone-dependent protoporphyrinogen oxidase